MSKSKGVVLGEGFVNRVGPAGSFIGNREGYGSSDLPKGYVGGADTVASQYEGDQKGNRQVEDANGWAPGTLGTRARTALGNPDEASTTRADHRYGIVLGENGQDMNNPSSNGNGVLLDGMSRQSGYNPKDAATMDSPVPAGSPKFDTRTIRQENLAHLGQGIGASPAQAADDIGKIGGVMSRED